MINPVLELLGNEMFIRSRTWFPAAYNTPNDTLIHLAMGVAGEGGEVIDVVKKMHARGMMEDPEYTDKIRGELADVLTYVLMLGNWVGIDWLAELRAAKEKCEERWGKVDVPGAIL